MVQDIEKEISRRLGSLPRSVGTSDDASAAVERAQRRAHRRRSRNSGVLAAAVASAVVVTGGGSALVASHLPSDRSAGSPSPTSSSQPRFAGWAPRGDALNDVPLIAAAAAAVPSSLGIQLSTTPLYAGSVSGSGHLVVLTGTDHAGAKVAVFVTSAPSGGKAQWATRTVVRAVVPIQPGQSAIGFVSPSVQGDLAYRSEGAPNLAIALVAPTITRASIANSLLDGRMANEPDADMVRDQGVLTAMLPVGSGMWNTTVNTVPSRSADAVTMRAGVGDPVVNIGELTRSSDGTIQVTSTGPIHQGDLIATSDGLLGTVRSASGNRGSVDTNLSGLRDVIATSGYRGTLSVADGRLWFEPSGATPNGVSRIVVRVPGTNPVIDLSVGVRTTSEADATSSSAEPAPPWEIVRSEPGDEIRVGSTVPAVIVTG